MRYDHPWRKPTPSEAARSRARRLMMPRYRGCVVDLLFNERGGLTFFDAGPWRSRSGATNNLAVTDWSEGFFGPRLFFGGNSDYLTLPQFSGTFTEFSWLIWCRWTVVAVGDSIIFSRGTDPNVHGVHVGYDGAGNKLAYSWNNAGFSNGVGPTIIANRDYLLSVRIQSGATDQTLISQEAGWENGVDSAAHGPGTFEANTVRLGMDAQSGTRSFNGYISRKLAFNRKISDAELWSFWEEPYREYRQSTRIWVRLPVSVWTESLELVCGSAMTPAGALVLTGHLALSADALVPMSGPLTIPGQLTLSADAQHSSQPQAVMQAVLSLSSQVVASWVAHVVMTHGVTLSGETSQVSAATLTMNVLAELLATLTQTATGGASVEGAMTLQAHSTVLPTALLSLQSAIGLSSESTLDPAAQADLVSSLTLALEAQLSAQHALIADGLVNLGVSASMAQTAAAALMEAVTLQVQALLAVKRPLALTNILTLVAAHLRLPSATDPVLAIPGFAVPQLRCPGMIDPVLSA